MSARINIVDGKVEVKLDFPPEHHAMAVINTAQPFAALHFDDPAAREKATVYMRPAALADHIAQCQRTLGELRYAIAARADDHLAAVEVSDAA